MRNVSDKSCRENQNTCCVITPPPLPPENCAVYEIMWKKHVTARQATDDNILGRMHSACLITKAWIKAHTHNILYALLFHDNKGYANAPKCCVIHSMPSLLLVGYAFACSAPVSTATTLIERSTCGQFATVFVLTIFINTDIRHL